MGILTDIGQSVQRRGRSDPVSGPASACNVTARDIAPMNAGSAAAAVGGGGGNTECRSGRCRLAARPPVGGRCLPAASSSLRRRWRSHRGQLHIERIGRRASTVGLIRPQRHGLRLVTASATVTDISPPPGTVSSHGVRQVWPLRRPRLGARRLGLDPQGFGRRRRSEEVHARQGGGACSKGEATCHQGNDSAHGSTPPIGRQHRPPIPRAQPYRARPGP